MKFYNRSAIRDSLARSNRMVEFRREKVIQAPPNSHVELLKVWGIVAGIVSVLLTTIAFLRRAYLNRSHLSFIHKEDETEQSFVRTDKPHFAFATTTLLVTNRSSRPNAIIKWAGTACDEMGTPREISLIEQVLVDRNPGSQPQFPPFNVTPLALSPFSTAQAHLMFSLDMRGLPNPVVFDVSATDSTHKIYLLSVSIPHVVRNLIC